MMGIYKITQKSTDKVYIGQSKNIEARWSQHIKAIDNLSFHEAFRKDPKDFIFEIIEVTDNENDLDRLEKLHINRPKANDPKHGFNATSGNGELKENKPITMKSVRGSINRYIYTTYLKNVENKKILIIGNFKFCDTLSLYNNITVITDDFGFTCEDAKSVILAADENSLKGEINKMKNNYEHFDLIIANPPYGKGNEIVSNFISLADESIVLMPFSKYKNRGLYKHVLSLELANPKDFPDADITNNLCVCKLTNKEINQTLEEVELQTFDPKYKEFYELNARLRPLDLKEKVATLFKGTKDETIKQATAQLEEYWKDHNRKFCLTWRAVHNGTHKADGNAFDVCWNVKKEINWGNLPISYCEKSQGALSQLRFITFPSEKECANFIRFFYAGGKNGLMNKFVKGMNKTGGTLQKAIPQIDWSVDRDYEHLTYDELLKIMREELNE